MEFPEELRGKSLTRRELLAFLGMAGAAFTPAAAWASSARPLRLARHAAATQAAGSDLEAVQHIIFLMMENRSYDHYFGAYPRGRGFDDHPKHSLGAFAQHYPGGSHVVPKHK